jgi:hypothetical protein
VSPIQKCCTLPPHEEATLPSWLPLPWPSPLPSLLPSLTLTPTLLPSPSPSQLPIAVAVAVVHCCGCREPLPSHLCHLAVSHLCRHRPCRWTLPSPSLSAIAVAIAISHHHCHDVGHFRELLPWRGKNCISPIKAKNTYLILFCWDCG